MSSTNLKQWNPTAANQETDAQYAADAQRLGGAINPSLFDAKLANKLFFQVTTYLTALFTALANKGYTSTDTSLGTLTAVCANVLTNADLRSPTITPAFSPSLSIDCSKSDGFNLVLTGNITSMALLNPVPGQLFTIVFKQDSAGGRTVAWPGIVLGNGTVDSTPNATSIQTFAYYTTDNKFHPISLMTVS